jgi:hypothetical protein
MVLFIELFLSLSFFQFFLLFLLYQVCHFLVFLVSRLNFLLIFKTENVLLSEVWEVIALWIYSTWQIHVLERGPLALRLLSDDITHDILLLLHYLSCLLLIEFIKRNCFSFIILSTFLSHISI